MLSRAQELAETVRGVVSSDCRPIVSDRARRDATLALAELERLAGEAGRLRGALLALLPLTVDPVNPQFALDGVRCIARAALKVAE